MKVLFLALDVDLKDRRGDAIHTRELARALAELGHTINLVSSSGNGVQLGGVRHYRLTSASDWSHVRFCSRLARTLQADVIYERRTSPKIACTVGFLTGVPFVLEINGSEQEVQMQGRNLRPVRKWLRTPMYRKAARIVTVTSPLASELRRSYRLNPEKISVVGNGVDPNQFRPMPRDQARSQLGLPPNPLITFVGNIAPWQGLRVLLEALVRLQSDHPDVRLAIIGDGPMRGTLETASRTLGLGTTVSFLGAVEHEIVPLYIGASDVCVVTSTRAMNERVGRSPIKLYEYMASGRVVVASDVPGVHEVLEKSQGGLLVPPDSPEALTRAISWLLENPRDAEAMGERGRSYAVTHCSWRRTAESIAMILENASIQGR